MEKIILRKDYKTRVVPVEESIGYYLAKRAARTWTEDFIDEDTKKTVTIDRCEVLLERGNLSPTSWLTNLKRMALMRSKSPTVLSVRKRNNISLVSLM